MWFHRTLAFGAGILVALAFVVLVGEVRTWYAWRSQITAAVNGMLTEQQKAKETH